MWLDTFFISNITPLFFAETLADLEKGIRSRRTPEEIVGSLARKTPDASPASSVHHMTLLQGELLGHDKIDMFTGRPIIGGGKTYELEGKLGTYFQPSPEQEAFRRWQEGKFLEVERSYAKRWREALSKIDFSDIHEAYKVFFPIGKPKTLEAVKKIVDFQLAEADQESLLVFGMSLLGIPERIQKHTLERWRNAGKPQISTFAPYFKHVFSVELFFNIAVAADLIGSGRPSHKIDLAYLYYLPFCMIFTSNDKLHGEIVPLFLRSNQTFIKGSDLKPELTKLDAHYDALPPEVKARGVMSFAFFPPDEDSFLVSKLWDKYMNPKWRELRTTPEPQPDTPHNREMLAEMKKFEKEGNLVPDSVQVRSDDVHHMAITRNVTAIKGKWLRVPPEILKRRKNEKGEWEDIPNG